MNLILWLLVGSAVGWLAGLAVKAEQDQALVLNVAVGFFGAFLGGWFVSPLVDVGSINQIEFSLPSVAVALAGAVVLLAAVHLFRRLDVRRHRSEMHP